MSIESPDGLGIGVAGSTRIDTAGGLMNEHAAAAFLGYSIRALQNWRLRGGGPQYVKVSEKSVRYQRCDLQAWIDARLCTGTATGQAIAGGKTVSPSHCRQVSHEEAP
jgi:hypothetical protein